MQTYSIQAPNGKTYQIEGPEGASQDQVQAEVLRQFPEASGGLEVTVTDTGGPYDPRNFSVEQIAEMEADGLKLNPQTGMYERPPDTRETSFIEGLAQGINKPLNNAARWAEGGLDAIGLGDSYRGLSSSLGFAPDVSAAEQEQQRIADAAPYRPSGFGEFSGNMVGTVPTMLLPGGALIQGAAGGALLSDGNSVYDVGKDALLGAAGAKAGEVIFRGLARSASPQISDDLRTLIDAGVEVTPGQVARSEGGAIGNFLARSEDRGVSTPFVGDRIVSARNRSLDTFGTAAVNRALEPIGMALPADLSGRRAVRYAGDRLGDAYDAILPRLSATGDQQFAHDLAAIHQEAGNMLPARLDQFNNILGGLGRYWQNGVSLDGRALKEIETRIGERVRRAAMSTDADQRELGDRLGDVMAAVRDLAARQNPAEAEALGRINQGWKSLTQVENAAGNSTGVITPAGYSRAVRMSSDTARRRGYARGEALNQDLSDAASNVLPSEIADSGTAGRWQQSNIIANLIGAAQVPAYAAARGVTPLLTREAGPAGDALSELLRYGSRAAPVIAPASIQALSK